MINKIIAKLKNYNRTPTQMFPWTFTRFWCFILESALRSCHSLATFNRRVLKKHLEFFFSLWLVLFLKKETPSEVFSSKFFKIFGETFCKEQLQAAASMTSKFLSPDKEQSTFWCLYYDIWACFYVFDEKS